MPIYRGFRGFLGAKKERQHRINTDVLRWFIGGAASFGAFAGCKVFADELGAFSGPGAKLKVGVVSDIHVLKDNYDSCSSTSASEGRTR